MLFRVLLTALLALFCGALQAQPVSYSRDVQPILTRKCLACHACYDAPCQLKLDSREGIERGASPLPVYNGQRTKPQATTRLFVDAHNEAGWRALGFHSVLGGGDAALVARMIELGHANPLPPNSKLPDNLDISIERENMCPRPDQFDEFKRKNPGIGMPFAVTGLDRGEYTTLRRWLAEGARLDGKPLVPNVSEAQQIAD